MTFFKIELNYELRIIKINRNKSYLAQSAINNFFAQFLIYSSNKVSVT
jgi:hypothetical protein